MNSGAFGGGEHRRSMPWAASEFLLINGQPCVYSTDESGCMVHFPGGISVNLAELRKTYVEISEPAHWRKDNWQ
jgi:hypothetical protein